MRWHGTRRRRSRPRTTSASQMRVSLPPSPPVVTAGRSSTPKVSPFPVVSIRPSGTRSTVRLRLCPVAHPPAESIPAVRLHRCRRAQPLWIWWDSLRPARVRPRHVARRAVLTPPLAEGTALVYHPYSTLARMSLSSASCPPAFVARSASRSPSPRCAFIRFAPPWPSLTFDWSCSREEARTSPTSPLLLNCLLTRRTTSSTVCLVRCSLG